jgi:uncharacterized protein YcbX
MASGTVQTLRRFPVKSFAGEIVDAFNVDGHGVAGDRTHALYVKGGKRLTARVAPRLLAWGARYADHPGDALLPHDPPAPQLTDPDGRPWRWGEEGLAEMLSEHANRDVDLTRDPAGQQDLADSILITVEDTRAQLEDELGAPVDIRRFRPNIHVQLDTDPFAENGWEGRRLRIGDAELELLHPCVRCVMVTKDPDTQETWAHLLRHLVRRRNAIFGINARPVRPARIAAGDSVELV